MTEVTFKIRACALGGFVVISGDNQERALSNVDEMIGHVTGALREAYGHQDAPRLAERFAPKITHAADAPARGILARIGGRS